MSERGLGLILRQHSDERINADADCEEDSASARQLANGLALNPEEEIIRRWVIGFRAGSV